MPDARSLVDRKDLIEEFRRKPVGAHSGDLQHLLNLLRNEPLEGKHVLVCTKPGREWALAQLSGVRGGPVRIHGDRTFHSLAEAELEVFKLRWERLTGRTLKL